MILEHLRRRGLREWSGRARRQRATKRVAYDPALAATLGGVAVPEAEQRRILEALGFARRRRLDRHRSRLAARHRRRRRHRRGSGPHPRARQHRQRRPCRARTASPGRPRRRRRSSSAACAAPPPRAASTRRSPGRSCPRPRPRPSPMAAHWVLANPISEDMKAMRPSLLPGLLAAARRNLDRGAPGLRLFEIGRRYLRGEGGTSDERLSLAVVLAGEKQRARLGDRQGGELRCLRRQGRGAGTARRSRRAGRQSASDGRGRQRSSTPASRRRCGWGRRTCWRASACCIRRCCRQFDIDAPVAAAELFLDAIPARKGAAGFARGALCAAGAAGGDARLCLPRAGGAASGRSGPRGQGRGQGQHRRGAAVRSCSGARACPRGRSRWRSKSRSSRARRAMTRPN